MGNGFGVTNYLWCLISGNLFVARRHCGDPGVHPWDVQICSPSAASQLKILVLPQKLFPLRAIYKNKKAPTKFVEAFLFL
jgi:hypothetical protein